MANGLFKCEEERKLRIIREEYELREKLYERKVKMDSSFSWTSENVRRIVALNDGLLQRYRQMYDEMIRVRNEYEERYANGDNNYKDYTIDVEVWYPADENMSEEEGELWGNLCENSYNWGPHLHCSSRDRDKEPETFEEVMCLNGQSWNIEPPFQVKELEGVMIYFFMHDIFDHNDTYSLEDAVRMKAENFCYQLVICLEHWSNG